MAASTIKLLKKRQTIDDPLSLSETSLPLRRANPSAASLYASTLTPPGSRSISPAGRASPGRNVPGPTALGATFTRSLLETGAAENPGDPLNLLLKAFVPHIAVYSSQDTEELAREKGFEHGLWELLRPFGERVQGKVNVRDSNGAARTWEDFSVRFTRFGQDVEQAGAATGGARSTTNGQSTGQQPPTSTETALKRIAQVETVVERHLRYAEESFLGLAQTNPALKQGLDIDATSPYYSLYVRRLLSGIPLVPHETFAHPVACVIAISSRNPSPIQTFRELYREISQGERQLPGWVDGDYLRYYVLVHDEENGDITKSMALFEQMKRHLGLHCHLLRIRSSQSAETDDDSIPLPRSEWMTAAEELADIERSESPEEFQDPTRYIFESDATAIRTFVREMVTQSVVPTMERNVSVWNDQVASKRKGISGRFMSLSKRWAGFGGSRSSGGASGSGSNFDQGFYSPDTPEAIMRKLADFAFMLRDWKLAMSTYDILRSDFNNDKAWRFHAAANEMAALALLIMPQNMSSKTKLENINSMIEQAFYSYHTRCSDPYGALRCLIMSLELLRLRAGPAIDDGVRWGSRLMEIRLVGAVGDALVKERMAVCCASKQGVGSMSWGSRRRKSAFWSVLSAETWLNQSKYIQAQRCLNEARQMYSMLQSDDGISGFGMASDFMAGLQMRLKEGLSMHGPAGLAAEAEHGEGEYEQGEEEDEVEVLAGGDSEKINRRRSRRASLIASSGATGATLETAPLRTIPTAEEDEKSGGSPGDKFEES
ncbi:uncharacterized protein E0L32_004878 [Thyridium curvatum]|uniref:Uncharacterized protein n=1 Tax=Thyridium curvatum TaxID=1093900 RepID=A0A507BE37_9PEZI|nr:uncharacterized protein E0L32_004878 [Thyridium curvatum]TPX15048.1 hypothetical protein E0L32_004878 [Thyridium curvatum]